MEIEYFVKPEEWEAQFTAWLAAMHEWIADCGIDATKTHDLEVEKGELAHYSKRTVDIEFDFPFGKKELYGLAYRTDFDLQRHAEASGKELTYTDPETNEKFVPHVIEPSFGVDRTFLAVMLSAYHEEEADGETRVVLKLPAHLAPVKVAVLPLSKKEELTAVSLPLAQELAKHFRVDHHASQSIGKRYRQNDEIGTPFCITVDFDTLGETPSLKDTVTVRDRDTMTQDRVAIEHLVEYLNKSSRRNYGTAKTQNGTRVHLVPMEGTQAMTALVLYRVGSRNESLKVWGGSHFIEHLMFKGTKRRPSSRELTQLIDRYGAEYNAYTGKDRTGYYIKIDGSKADVAIDVLGDMLTGSLFEAKEMKKERQVIIEEIKMYAENPIMHVEDLLEDAMFAGHTLGRNIAGTAKTMMDMKRADVVAYRDAYYAPSNTVIVLAGAVPANATALLEKAFGKAKDRKLPERDGNFVTAKPSAKPRVGREFKALKQAQLALGSQPSAATTRTKRQSKFSQQSLVEP